MEKPNHKKTLQSTERDQNRLTTAPVRQRPKHMDLFKTTNFELPLIKAKNYIGRQPVIATRDTKRSTVRKEEQFNHEYEHHETHKRPQTSKGSRNCNKHESQYYEDDGDDLIVTSMHERIQNMKKLGDKFFQHNSTKNP